MARRPALLAAVLAVLLAAVAAAAAEGKLVVSAERAEYAVPAGGAEPEGVRGRLHRVGGTGARTGPGPVRRYLVEVEGGLAVDRRAFAERVHAILGHGRGWGGSGRVSFRRVPRGPVDFRVTLASARLTDRLCAPLLTLRTYSCATGGRAVLNLKRWRHGAEAYRGELGRYRVYLVNHEVGHLLGNAHASCPAAGARAPVMMQQTKGVGACRATPWPRPWERG